MEKIAAGRSWTLTTENAAGTIEAGRELVRRLPPPRLMILRGELGSGKTTLVKGMAEALGAADRDEVTSPTFTLVHEYEGELQADHQVQHVNLYHLDVYRIETERQLETLGIEELLTPDSVVLIEWGEKFESLRKRADGEILVETTGGDGRRITVTLKG